LGSKTTASSPKKEGSAAAPNENNALGGSELCLIDNLDQLAAETVPLVLLVPKARYAFLNKGQLAERLRSQFFLDFGVSLPEMMMRSSDELEDNRAVLLINEIRAEEFLVQFDLLRVVNYSEEIEQLGIHIVSVGEGVWVDAESKETVQKLGYQLRPAIDELYQCFATLLAHHVNEYFGVQETKQMLDLLEGKYPDLLKEVLRHATVQRIAEVLQRLLSERISIRNMKLIMESLAHWAPREKDVIALVEHVRGSLARYICHKFAVGNELRAIVVSAEIEDVVRKGIRQTSNGSFLNLEPADSEELMDAFAVALDGLSIAHKDLVLLASVDVRRFIKKLIESRFRDLEVVSFGEISDSVSVNVIKSI
ncbi:MAG: FHIPEP family type III secretion protein, partial [Burkholderiales bacterium]|nr:FHIPEP family type III secretion protein [Burkholderiales bacterium]